MASRHQTTIQAWVQSILDQRQWTWNKLARVSDLAPNTVSRIFKEPHLETSLRTIQKIADATGTAPPVLETKTAPWTGFAEPEAKRLRGDPLPGGLKERTPNQSVWELTSRAIELTGYMPGDRVLVDMAARPRAGDIVCVQLYDHAGSAKTVFRVFEPPYVTTRTSDPASHERPRIADDERLKIMGVVTKMLRQRAE